MTAGIGLQGKTSFHDRESGSQHLLQFVRIDGLLVSGINTRLGTAQPPGLVLASSWADFREHNPVGRGNRVCGQLDQKSGLSLQNYRAFVLGSRQRDLAFRLGDNSRSVPSCRVVSSGGNGHCVYPRAQLRTHTTAVLQVVEGRNDRLRVGATQRPTAARGRSATIGVTRITRVLSAHGSPRSPQSSPRSATSLVPQPRTDGQLGVTADLEKTSSSGSRRCAAPASTWCRPWRRSRPACSGTASPCRSRQT